MSSTDARIAPSRDVYIDAGQERLLETPAGDIRKISRPPAHAACLCLCVRLAFASPPRRPLRPRLPPPTSRPRSSPPPLVRGGARATERGERRKGGASA